MSVSLAEARGSSLDELLGVPELRLRLVCASGSALDRPVRWVYTTELVHLGPYLRGGELVCTVGSNLVDQESCDAFVECLRAARVVGLCFGSGDVHRDIPEPLIRACRRSEVPLLELPEGVRFLAITEYLAQQLLSAGVATNAQLTGLTAQLLTAVRQKVSISSLLQMAERELGGRFTLRQPNGRVVGSDPELGAGFESEDVSVPIAEGGRLCWSPDRGDGRGDVDDEALVQIGRVLDIACYEEELEQNGRRERLGLLFELVADGLADVAALFPSFSESGVIAGTVTASVWAPGCAAQLGGRLHAALLGDAPDAVYAVTATAAQVREAAADLSLVCGYGSTVPLIEVGRSISEARACLEIAQRTGEVVGPSKLTSLVGLLEQQPWKRLRPFVDQLLRPVLDHDRRHGTQLLDTLRAFLHHDGNLQETARAQYLHVNTVRNRLGRVAQLSGHDPLSFDGRAALEIAMWARDRSQRRLGSH
ncbi:MAG: PucR family transcriptional regulator ligand-binding domain-containing protein [Acidipropionibacterium sp.]|jgi:hypothetical protein|nr:PucR family transcriptional regulator ligand-binding domain-containing protein [Acidipropionibacterium sp.]